MTESTKNHIRLASVLTVCIFIEPIADSIHYAFKVAFNLIMGFVS